MSQLQVRYRESYTALSPVYNMVLGAAVVRAVADDTTGLEIGFAHRGAGGARLLSFGGYTLAL